MAIARALVFQPRVLLMDEPLSNLDAKLREQMRVEIRALQQRLGITTVYVTHDQEEAMVLSDEIAVMHEGRVLQIADPQTIYTRPANRTVAAFVGAPNLLQAKAREVRRGSGLTQVRVEGDGWEGWCAGPEDLAAGEPVTVIVRPEVIQLGERAGAGHRMDGPRAPALLPRRPQRLHDRGRPPSLQRGRRPRSDAGSGQRRDAQRRRGPDVGRAGVRRARA